MGLAYLHVAPHVLLASCDADRFRLVRNLGPVPNLRFHTALVSEVAKDSPTAPSSVACLSASHGNHDYPDNRSYAFSRA